MKHGVPYFILFFLFLFFPFYVSVREKKRKDYDIVVQKVTLCDSSKHQVRKVKEFDIKKKLNLCKKRKKKIVGKERGFLKKMK